MTDIIYFDFFMCNEHFPVEDYGDNGYAVFNEGCFVAEIPSPDTKEAYSAASKYLKAFKW